LEGAPGFASVAWPGCSGELHHRTIVIAYMCVCAYIMIIHYRHIDYILFQILV
jgi:hypothetical protein